MSIGNWVETNLVLPLADKLLEPGNLAKIATAFEPTLSRLFSTGITQVGLEVQAGGLKVINTIGEQARASEEKVLSGVDGSISNIENTLAGFSNSIANLPGTVINSIKGLNPFHFGSSCPKCGHTLDTTTG